MTMIERLKYYHKRISAYQDDVQNRLDNMNMENYSEEQFDDISSRREEQIELLQSIVDSLGDVIEFIDDYNDQFRGLKSIR